MTVRKCMSDPKKFTKKEKLDQVLSFSTFITSFAE